MTIKYNQNHSPAATPAGEAEHRAERSVFTALIRGTLMRCPNCNQAPLFLRYLKPVDQCSNCNEAYHHQRADDAPPYFTIFILGHIIVPLMLWVEIAYEPSLWVHAAIWGPLTIALTLLCLPLVKGALIGLQWALRMHGFSDNDVPDPANLAQADIELSAPANKS